MSDKTDLQREILLAWDRNPSSTNQEIADQVGCSASYVSQVKSQFDSYDEFSAAMDRMDRNVDQMLEEQESLLDDDLDFL